MQITLDINTAQLQAALAASKAQFPFAMMTALNKSALQAKSDLQTRLPAVFKSPTPWVINSLHPRRPEDFATKDRLAVRVSFQDRFGDGRTMVEPHVYGGTRRFKAMEARLLAAGYLPRGYNVVPGAGATLDAYGNMSAGQISQILNVLGTYTEGGYNTANSKTKARLAKGTRKTYGFEYFVSYGSIGRSTYTVNKYGEPVLVQNAKRTLAPGVYKRVYTAFGTSLKPMLMFVKRAQYKERLDFYGIGNASFNQHFPGYFDTAFQQAMKTALLKDQGALF